MSKFKVIDEEFQVVLWVEDKVNGANRSNIAIPATEIAVSNNVCTEFLALSAADYAAMTSHCSKAELKESKKQVCLRFEKFAGLFLVQIVSPTFKSTNKSGKSSSSSSSQSPSVCIVKIAALDD